MEYTKIKNHWKTKVPYIDTNDAINDYKDSIVAKSENNDCVIRAFAAVTGSTYDKSHAYVKKTFNRPKGVGTPRFDSTMKYNQGKRVLGSKYERLTNHTETTYVKTTKDRVWGSDDPIITKCNVTVYSRYMPLITKYGKTRVSQMTVKTFLRDYNVGKYLVHVRGHAFAILDGVVVGNICDSQRMKARIVNAYKFK